MVSIVSREKFTRLLHEYDFSYPYPTVSVYQSPGWAGPMGDPFNKKFS